MWRHRLPYACEIGPIAGCHVDRRLEQSIGIDARRGERCDEILDRSQGLCIEVTWCHDLARFVERASTGGEDEIALHSQVVVRGIGVKGHGPTSGGGGR